MKIAGRISAEFGWSAALLRADGSVHYAEFKEWGIYYCYDSGKTVRPGAIEMTRLFPVDPITGDDMTKERTFLALVEPNTERNSSYILNLASSKLEELNRLDTSG